MAKGLIWKVRVYWDAGTDEWIVLAKSDDVARRKAMKLSNEINKDEGYTLRYVELTVEAVLDA